MDEQMDMVRIFAVVVVAAAGWAVAHADVELPESGLKVAAPAPDSIECRISGTVVGCPDTEAVVIIEAGKDFRVNDRVIVPVVDGRYEYTLRSDKPRAYEVMFDDEMRQGSWRIRNFYSGDGSVQIISTADSDSLVSDLHDNILAQRWTQIEQERFMPGLDVIYAKIDSLYEHNVAYRPEVKRLDDEYAAMEPGAARDSVNDLRLAYFRGPREKCYTDEYMAYERQGVEILKEMDRAKRAFIMEHPSLYGLSVIKDALSSMRRDWIDAPAYIGIFETSYRDVLPDHPYTIDIMGQIDAREVKVGNKYPDYKVTRPDGSTASMASLIKGNVAVIDLWASWCLPCRRHSRELIPVYEKYKDKGFKVIAVARESDNCDAMHRAMADDGYPWESFVDINDADKVWMINNAGNAGGRIILVDATGTIISADASIPQIADYLQSAYNE